MKSKFSLYGKILNRKIIYIVGLLYVCCCSNIATAQIKHSKIIGGYVYNFAKNITWPNIENNSAFNITIITENEEIINEFHDMADKRQIKGEPIKLTVLNKLVTPITNAQLIFIAADKAYLFLDVFDEIEGFPILLISENYDDKRFVMINLYDADNNKVLFEINKANILNQELKINDEILLLGGNEIDVARLYQESQQSLRRIQKRLENNKVDLKNLKSQINTRNKEITKQQIQIDQQSSLIISQQNIQNDLQAEISNQRETIDEQQYLLLREHDSLQLLASQLNISLKQLSKQNEEIKEGKQILQVQKEEISRIDKEIRQKNEIFEQQRSTIDRQRQMMYMFVAIIFLIIIIVVVNYLAYRNNKRKNKQLNAQKIEIEKINKDLAKRGEALVEANIKLKEGDRLKSAFLANMSHELRTPLNSIIGFTGMILMGIVGDLNEEQRKQLTMVKTSASHLLSLINDILDISKIEAERTEVFPEEFYINSILQEVIDTIKPLAIEKGIDLIEETAKQTLIFTDRKCLKQILINLVVNAVKFTDDGSVTVKTEITKTKSLEVHIIDTGIGIKKEDIDKLFKMFMQVDMSSTRKHEGTGLGLFLSMRLANLLQGNITAKSEYGAGSVFTVSLPLKYKEIK